MLLGACTTSNAASREVGCKATNGSGEGRRDIRRVSCSQPLYQNSKFDDFLSKSSAATAEMVAIAKWVGNPKFLAYDLQLGRTAKTTCNRGACVRAHALHSFVKGG